MFNVLVLDLDRQMPDRGVPFAMGTHEKTDQEIEEQRNEGEAEKRDRRLDKGSGLADFNALPIDVGSLYRDLPPAAFGFDRFDEGEEQFENGPEHQIQNPGGGDQEVRPYSAKKPEQSAADLAAQQGK